MSKKDEKVDTDQLYRSIFVKYDDGGLPFTLTTYTPIVKPKGLKLIWANAYFFALWLDLT